jgi:hypothetical protein
MVKTIGMLFTINVVFMNTKVNACSCASVGLCFLLSSAGEHGCCSMYSILLVRYSSSEVLKIYAELDVAARRQQVPLKSIRSYCTRL